MVTGEGASILLGKGSRSDERAKNTHHDANGANLRGYLFWASMPSMRLAPPPTSSTFVPAGTMSALPSGPSTTEVSASPRSSSSA